jgi:hypothetical protein
VNLENFFDTLPNNSDKGMLYVLTIPTDIVAAGSAFIKEFFHENAPENLPKREKKPHVPT